MFFVFFFLLMRRPPRSTQSRSSAASDVYKRQQRVMPDYVAVGASKAALEALTRYLAVEFAPMNIIVNAVSPSLVETEALKHFAALADPKVIQRATQNTPAGRLVTPEDVAGVVAFLCSPAAFMIRGQVIVIDGGYLLKA